MSAPKRKRTILLWGDSGDGKSALLAEWAESEFNRTGKKMLLFNTDPGVETMGAHIDADLIDLVDLTTVPYPFEAIRHAARGYLPNEKTKKWEPADMSAYHTWAKEGITSLSDILMTYLSDQAEQGKVIGGQRPNVMFKDGDQQIAGSAPSFYGTVQGLLRKVIPQSFQLPVDTVIWTARARRGSDENQDTVLGPQAAGAQLTATLPGMFMYTFRVMAIPEDTILKRPEEHRLYLGDHTDHTAVGAKALGNNRLPIGSALDKPYVSPASLVQAMQILDAARQATVKRIKEKANGK